ncbi:hypothetical protein BZL30_4572 [Mycobacterium kansasii]|uniref:Uncharacterized protein n=1 Tax=Mycobacterium kansasii TaxID=1768 RepID=A0A1V3X4D8_MYCKA|nr:hypothetical protein BZL30_4572 [Mycobacterium kansasii]
MGAPQFYALVLQELSLIGHRGPAEVEMLSTSYADNPELLVRMVAKALSAPPAPEPQHPAIPLRAKPVALLAARQLRDREVRRDRMVRAIWVLRDLLREYGRRLVEAGVVETADDVFYLLVDELDALPGDVAELVARRRAEQRRLTAVVPPTVFSGTWEPSTGSSAALGTGDTLRGVGVCGGRVRGRVRIVRPETIDDLQPGEILVAEVTDVGYTAAFCYAAAVVTELGGPCPMRPWWPVSSASRVWSMSRVQRNTCSRAHSSRSTAPRGRFTCSSWLPGAWRATETTCVTMVSGVSRSGFLSVCRDRIRTCVRVRSRWWRRSTRCSWLCHGCRSCPSTP